MTKTCPSSDHTALPAVVALRLRTRVSSRPEWADDLLGRSLTYRLRWAATNLELMRGEKGRLSSQRMTDQLAYLSAPKEAIESGRVVAEVDDWIEDPTTGQILPFNVRDSEGKSYVTKSGVSSIEDAYIKAADSFDYLVSMITDMIREVANYKSGLIDSASLCYAVLREGDGAVLLHWDRLQPELLNLAGKIEQWRPDAIEPSNDTERDIIEALRNTGHRVTTDKLLRMALGGVNSHGKSTLANMVKRGLITNRSDTKPRGYGLPEWDLVQS